MSTIADRAQLPPSPTSDSVRTILLPGKLCRKLMDYARKKGIASGEVFVTRSGRGMSRRQIWQEMKGLCKRAGVNPSLPQNLYRHIPHLGHPYACGNSTVLEQYIAKLHQTYRPRSAKRKIAAIKALFRYFEYREIIDKNPFYKKHMGRNMHFYGSEGGIFVYHPPYGLIR